MASMMVAVFLFVCLNLVLSPLSEAVTCNDAINALIPCGSYLMGASPTPGAQCCNSAKKLDTFAATRESRKMLCECFKQVGPSFGIHPTSAGNLPILCKLNIKMPVSLKTDCSNL